MIKNYLKIALRNMAKYKGYSFINILGLAIGLACTLVIFSFIQNELSVDGYHQNKDQLVQAYLKSVRNGNTGYQSTVSPYIAPMLKDEYPEVLDVVRTGGFQEVTFETNGKLILENNGIAADPNIFDLFTYPMLSGDAKTALAETHSIVLTRSLAEKYFGSENVLGQTIRMDDRHNFLVTGVIEDLPANTYRTFDFIIPFQFLAELGNDIVGTPYFPCNYLTYARLKANTSLSELNAKISQRMISEGREITFDIELMPFGKVYLFETGGSTRLTIMSLVAVMILILACVNFINLSTARHMVRAKEVGIRKVTGATRKLIALQFMGESLLLSLVASAIGLVMAFEFLPVFNRMMSRPATIQFSNPVFWLGFLGLVFITGILAGLYPALFMARLQPVSVMKKEMGRGRKASLRKSLIIFQFALSSAFVLCTLVINRQIQFLRDFNLGVNKQNVLYITLDGEIRERFETVRAELLRLPAVKTVSVGSNLPTAIRSGSYFPWGKQDDAPKRICTTFTSPDYLKTFDIELAEGRYFSSDFPNDAESSIVVNEAAVRKAGLESPLGKPFYYDMKYFTLVGIVKDFHHNQLLSQEPEPLAFILTPSPARNRYLFVKIDPAITGAAAIANTMQDVQSVCQRFSPKRPLHYQFYSDFSFQREQLQQAMKLMFTLSTALAIFISCLGLLGLTSFMNQQKTKEVGIRKVLGASVPGILGILTKEIATWVLISNLIAWPVAWFAMHKWLENFAYRVDLTIWPFLLSGLTALVIAIFTVSWQAVRAATANPIEALKYE